MQSIRVLFSLGAMACLAGASVLSDLATNLPERTFVKMPANASLAGLSMDYSLLYYTDSGIWDPVNKRVSIVAGPGSCCASPAIYKKITYDEVSDTWSIVNTSFSGSGHAYDGNAADPKTGYHYFHWWGNAQVRRWNGVTWAMLPAHPLSSSCCKALAWFPELNAGQGGLVLVGSSGRAAWFNGTAWAAIPGADAAPWGDIEVFAEYNPVHKIVWMGSGCCGATGSERVSYFLDSQLKFTRTVDASFNLKANQALKTCDPVTGNFLVYSMNGSGSWWEMDPVKNAWSQVTGMKNQPALGTQSLFHAVIPEYGVVLIFKHSGSTRDVYLYRHSVGTAARSARAEAAFELTVSPNPVRGKALIRTDGNPAVAEVFRVDGRRVGTLKADAGPMIWNAEGLPAGLYVLKLTQGGKLFMKPMMVAR